MITIDSLGQVPKWTKGADCKSVAIGFQGSNPCLPTIPSLLEPSRSINSRRRFNTSRDLGKRLRVPERYSYGATDKNPIGIPDSNGINADDLQRMVVE
jgi:hypothetical protein